MNMSNKIPSLDNCEIHDLFKKRFTREPMNEDEIMEYIKSSGINLNDKHPLFGTVGKGLVLQWANDARYGFRPFSDVHKLLRQRNPLVSFAASVRNCRSVIKLFNKISNYFLI